MLASATDHLCRTQSYHFPGIVAGISMESLCSPTADEKYYNTFRSANQHLSLSSEINGKAFINDINRNISNEKVLKAIVTRSKEANANCDDTPENDDFGHRESTERTTNLGTTGKTVDRNATISAENKDEEWFAPVTTSIKKINNNSGECKENEVSRSSDGLLDSKLTKAVEHVPCETKIDAHDKTVDKNRDSGIPASSGMEKQNDLSNGQAPTSRNPFVNIRTLGDGSDGAYEISIQNLYPSDIYCVAGDDTDANESAASTKEKFEVELEEANNRSSASIGKSIDATPKGGHMLHDRTGDQKDSGDDTAEHIHRDREQETSSLRDEQSRYLNKDLMLKLQKLLKTCTKNRSAETDATTNDSTLKREYILMRPYSEDSSTPKLPESPAVQENDISTTPPIETYDVHRRRKRRPRKLPEIPRQNPKDFSISLPIKLHNQIQDPPNGTVLSLADEIRIAIHGNNEVNQSEKNDLSNHYPNKPGYSSENFDKATTVPSPPPNLGTDDEQILSMSQVLVNSTGVKSLVSLKELGSPEDIEPPSFRDSGFFQDIDYDEEIIKQQQQIEQQQQLLLRTLYKDRHGKGYAINDCDSGYTTQDPESLSRPSSVGPNLCCKCGSQVSATGEKEESVPKKLSNSQVASSLVSSSQSITDCYIDDIPKSKELPNRPITLEYTGEMCREPPDGGNSDKSPEEEEAGGTTKFDTTQTTTREKAPGNNDLPGISETELMYLDVTHRCCHKFIPRHGDELFIEIGDPIYVCKENDDLWCQGVNLRTKNKGIFPSVCATDLNFLEGEGEGQCRPVRFYLRFLGSVQVKYPKGPQVLTQAIQKVVMSRRMTLNSNPPPMSCLEINDYGIKLSEKTTRKVSSSSRMPRSLSQILGRGSTSATESDDNSHFYSLKNVTYCGYHATNQKYFAFITKHPLEMKFACHVMLGEESTTCISEAVSAVFKKYYQKYLAESHPTEDIYLED